MTAYDKVNLLCLHVSMKCKMTVFVGVKFRAELAGEILQNVIHCGTFVCVYMAVVLCYAEKGWGSHELDNLRIISVSSLRITQY